MAPATSPIFPAFNVLFSIKKYREIQPAWDESLRRTALKLIPLAMVLLFGWDWLFRFLDPNIPAAIDAIFIVLCAVLSAVWVVIYRAGQHVVRARYAALGGLTSLLIGSMLTLLWSSNTTYHETLFGAGLILFAAAVCLSWLWIYTALLALGTLAGFLAIVSHNAVPMATIHLSLFFLVGTACLSIIAQYYKNQVALNVFKATHQAEQARDIAQEARKQNMALMVDLERLTLEDPLTEIANRRAFNEFLNDQLASAYERNESVGLVMFDIDHFKKLNDKYGHQIGDHILREVAHGLARNTREPDMLARYGGEEFVLVAPNIGREELENLTETLRTGMWPPEPGSTLTTLMSQEEINDITLSAGAALYPQSAAGSQELVGAADTALYEAKQHGRNRSIITTLAAHYDGAPNLMHLAPHEIEALEPENELAAPSTRINRQQYQQEVRPVFQLLALWAGIIGFLTIGYWILVEFFYRNEAFWDFFPLRLVVQSCLLGATVTVLGKQRSYRFLSQLALAVMLVIQTQVCLMLPFYGTVLDDSLLAMAMTIFASAISMPWHWRYTVYTAAYSAAMWLLGGLLASEATVSAYWVNATFFWFLSATFSVWGSYLRNRSAWQEFVAKQNTHHAMLDARRQEERQREIVAKLAQLTREDALTKVANRRAFDEFLDGALRVAHAQHTQVGVVMLDIDHFKKLNDTFGHQAGDEVLLEVAQTLQSELPPGAFLARFGGEEFVIVLPNASATDLAGITETIRYRTCEDLLTANRCAALQQQVQLSAGAALFPVHGRSADQLVQAADAQLYEAKSAGRNRSRCAPPPPVPQQAGTRVTAGR